MADWCQVGKIKLLAAVYNLASNLCWNLEPIRLVCFGLAQEKETF